LGIYILISATSFPNLFEKFHRAITLHYSDNGQTLYDPTLMRKFTETCAPGLFDQVLSSISNDGKKREQHQMQRTVAILHNMSFFRNQVMRT